MDRIKFLLAIIIVFVCNAAYGEIILVLDPGHGGHDHGGWNGNGFCEHDEDECLICIPEDAYTFDIAKRLEHAAKEKGWSVVFTVRDKIAAEHVTDSDENYILPPRDTLIFNLPGLREVVYRGRMGLAKRIRVEEILRRQNPGATIVFVSIHIDITKPYVQGMHIFTIHEKRSLDLARNMVDVVREAGLSFRVHSQEYPMINDWNHLFVLRHGVITPRVLVEVGNFTNPRDRLAILRTEGRERYARVIVSAIENYLKK